jgi:mono/diheme cytochrome c family protein
MRYVLPAASALALLLCSGRAVPQAGGAASGDPHKELVDRYCIGCHNSRLKTGGLTLDSMDYAHIARDGEVWEKVIRKLRGGMMPPPGVPQPPRAAVEEMVAFLETTLDQAAEADPRPGSIVAHRMNRAEYENAVEDLLGVRVNAASLLPTDDIAEGFDNIANVLKVSPSFLDQYINAARFATTQAIGKPVPAAPVAVVLRGGLSDTESPHLSGGVPLGTQPVMLVEHLFPADGEYEFAIPGGRGGGRGGRGAAPPDGGRGGLAPPAPPGTVVTLDGVKIALNTRIPVKAGLHKVGMASAPRSFIETDTMLQALVPGGGGGAPGLQVTGPYNPTTPWIDAESRRRIFVCRPAIPAEEAACAAHIFTRFARLAFRRPVAEADLAGSMAMYRDARTDGDFESGVQAGLMAILASPKFLYRVEKDPEGARPGSIQPVTDLELASRLSFFLWSSIPDDELLTIAEQGRLRDPATLEQQVRRMLGHPRARTLVTSFAFQWLKVRDMDKIDPDVILFPNFNASLRQAFEKEMELWIHSLFAEDHPVTELLSSDYTFVNERLARHYGIPDIFGDQFRRVTLADSNRHGLLGKGAILMVTSYPNRTAPVLRGAWILEAILGTPPAAPPPDVEAFPETKEGETPKSVRERMEVHRRNPACNACHGVMDPLGFALENFTAVGDYVVKDRYTQLPIDASGKLVDGTEINGVSGLRQALLARHRQFAQTMTERLLTYALGRRLEHHDMPAVRRIVRDAAAGDYRFSSVVLGVVRSLPFQAREVPPAEATASR